MMYESVSTGFASSFTVPSSAWLKDSQDPDFPYTARISVENVTEADFVRADFDAVSWEPALIAQVSSTGNTVDNALIFKAKRVPGIGLGGFFTVHKAG